MSDPKPSHASRDGLLIALLSAAAFGSSGVFAAALIESGWSAGAAVLVRVAVGALLLLPAAMYALRGRWHLVPRHLPLMAVYGTVAVAGVQLSYFNAISHLSVGVALLLEYLGPVLLMGWFWLTTRRRPHNLSLIGAALSLAGLALVLDVVGGMETSLVGIAWGLAAAVGIAVYFVLSAHEMDGIPPVAAAAGGLVFGTLALGTAGALGLMPLRAGTADTVLAGTTMPFWVPVLAIGTFSTAVAYSAGIISTRMLGSGLASFIGLTEVLAAIAFSWVMLGQALGPIQLVGAVLVLAGVMAVRAGTEEVALLPLEQTAPGSGLASITTRDSAT